MAILVGLAGPALGRLRRGDVVQLPAGGALQAGSLRTATGPGRLPLGLPPADPDKDWVALVKR